MKKILFATFLALALGIGARAEEARLLRFPTVGGDNIVFCYAGNLYRVSVNGGEAHKLTSDVGYECFPKISPDGKTIAFTGQYDGNTEVYTIPIEGGEPKRLTFSALVDRDKVGERMGPNNIVMGWTPDGKKVIYRSKQYNFSGLRGRLCLVSAEGGLPEIIPTSEGGFCSYSPDGKRLAMNRMFREFRTWKYYRGGQADDIWINTVGTTKLEKITDNDAQDIFPMWIGSQIYYLSDRDRTMNLFCYDTKTKQTRKVTDFSEYDCKFPASSSSSIVFENGGYIYRYDVASDKTCKVDITLKDDDIYSRKEYRKLTMGFGGDLSLAPDGSRVLMVNRGDIFSLPAEKGQVYNLSRSPQSHEREPRWSPDGKTIAWISDESGEYQIHTAPASEPRNSRQLTHFKTGYPARLLWSPDSKNLYFTNEKNQLFQLDPVNGKLDVILDGGARGIRSFSLSPDGTWAAYVGALENKISAIYLFDMTSHKSYQVTDRWYDASQPLFSTDGKYLFFTSSRVFQSQYSAVEWNAAYNVSDYAFVLPLSADTHNPLTLSEPVPSVGPKDKKEAAKGPITTKVDIEGIGQRITALPLGSGRFRLTYAKEGKLYFSQAGKSKVLDLESLKVSDGPEISGNITPDGKKMLISAQRSLYVVPFGSPTAKATAVPTGDMDMIIDHEAEWKQIFDESWRITRDGFYVENMHGADWNHIHEKYGQMLPYVKHRDDLTYLIGEMLGELNVGHAYITSGESPEIPRVATGLLGAQYSKDSKTGAFRITKIWRGANWAPALRSPLTEPGLNIKVGDYLVEVAGVPASELTDPGQALIGKVDRIVELKVASNAAGKDTRSVLVRPIKDESKLAYYEWVQENIEKVDRLSGGEIGYIHIPDMSTEGLDCFTKLFYTQLDKKALIIDDRMNGGGNVSPMILERLQREVYRMSMHRNGINEPVPNEAFYGPKVCLIDKYSSSDGDLFPYGFRKLGLGKLIGTRSWGGIVGISGSKQFVDGQDMRTPFFTSYSTEGDWIIEGHGVDPDIVVDINPFEDYLGKDAQLEKAVEVLKAELKDYKALPPTPKAPVKN